MQDTLLFKDYGLTDVLITNAQVQHLNGWDAGIAMPKTIVVLPTMQDTFSL
jgi:hypothetical protein